MLVVYVSDVFLRLCSWGEVQALELTTLQNSEHTVCAHTHTHDLRLQDMQRLLHVKIFLHPSFTQISCMSNGCTHVCVSYCGGGGHGPCVKSNEEEAAASCQRGSVRREERMKTTIFKTFTLQRSFFPPAPSSWQS